MTTRIAATAAAIILSAALPLAAPAAACELELRSVNDINFSGRYDPFAGAQVPRSMRFVVNNRDKQDCLFGVGVNQGQNGGRRMSGAGGLLRYDILGPDNRTVGDAPATPLNGLLAGAYRGNSGTAPDLEVYAVIAPGQMEPAGGYSDQLTFSVYELVGGQPGRLHDSVSVAVRTEVGSAMQASLIVGGVRGLLAGRIATLDFGEMETGKTLPFELEIDGNSPYRVTLASENGGVMAGTEVGNRDSRVGYTVSMDGREVTLAGPLTMGLAAPSSSGRSSTQHAFQIRLGDVSRALAGRYADNLTVTVTAN